MAVSCHNRGYRTRKFRLRRYHVNLSVFRSAVDTWAIDQLFPIMPLQRLSEEPTTMVSALGVAAARG